MKIYILLKLTTIMLEKEINRGKDRNMLHLNQCFKLEEQTLTKSENFIETFVVDSDHLVRNDVLERQDIKTNELGNGKTKKVFTENLELKYECEHCCKLFKCNSCKHLQIHIGGKLLVNNYYQKIFAHHGYIKHLVVVIPVIVAHTGEKSFACEYCQGSFSKCGYISEDPICNSIKDFLQCSHANGFSPVCVRT